jgi:hypothetical protein
MTFNSEPNEASRKTLDDIRRELDAEYGYVEIETSTPDVRANADDRPPRRASFGVREPADDPRPRRASLAAQTSAAWRDGDDVNEIDDVDDTIDASVSDFRAIADRHERPLGRSRAVTEDRPRRSGYLIAAIVGGVAGQALLLAFFTMTRPGGLPEWVGTIAALRPRNQATAPMPTPVPPAAEDGQPAAETPPQTDVPAPSSPSAATVASPAVPPESKPDVPDAPPPRLTPEPPAASSPAPAVVSTATVTGQSADLPPRVAREPRVTSSRPPVMASPHDWAKAQARLRSALNQWLKASAAGGTSVPAAEPVIVLNADGRTAKTFVSMVSPIGLIPREQRWELGPGGWSLIEDRQAGLPTQGTAPTSRGR